MNNTAFQNARDFLDAVEHGEHGDEWVPGDWDFTEAERAWAKGEQS